jgi:arylformamidase
MKSEIEIQYNNRARIAETPQILQQWSDNAAAYRARMAASGHAELTVAYGTGPRHIVDLFWPAQDRAGHIVVFIHGGYWQLFEPALFSHLARGANARGIPMALMGYDLCPAVTVDEIVAQIRSACVFLWRRYKRRLVLTGHSAGGHLTAAMLATDWAAEGVDPHFIASGLSISGVFELLPLLDTSMNDKLRMTEAAARALSPIGWTPRPAAQIDAWVGGAESEEVLRQSRDFAAAWAAKGARTRFETVDGANHFTIIAALTDPDSRMMQRLCEVAGIPAPSRQQP